MKGCLRYPYSTGGSESHYGKVGRVCKEFATERLPARVQLAFGNHRTLPDRQRRRLERAILRRRVDDGDE